MKPLKALASILSIIVLATTMGCATSRNHEGTGQYLDDSVITTKVKASILNEPGLKSSEINVETYKGVVQLSGFVSSAADIQSAIKVAEHVDGVTSVTNKMQLKQGS